jgi:hypothetical protein
MKKHLRRFAIFLVFAVVLVACGSAVTTNEAQPSSAHEVETIVAMTLQALAPEAANTPIVRTPANVPEAPASLLPQSLYFLGTGKRETCRSSVWNAMERPGHS